MRSKTLLAMIFVAGACAAFLRADQRVIPPAIAKVWPVGMERGTTATFTIDGRNLADIKMVIFDAPGITAKALQVSELPEQAVVMRQGLVQTTAPVALGKKQAATLEVTAAKDTAPGIHWFRIRTPLGTSNLMPFEVGAFPEVTSGQKSDGQTEAPPQALTLPATLVGTIAVPGEIDRYEFDGRAGEELVFQVSAAPLRSELESFLVLRNEAGQIVAESGDHQNSADAVLTCKLPNAGKYTLAITDREKGGSPAHYYRIVAGPLPYITQVFPLGVRAGEPATISVSGVNLDGQREVKVNPPSSSDGWATMPLALKSKEGWSINTVKLAVGNDPEIIEKEPNNSPAQAQVISLPVTINGHISGGAASGGSPDDDYFRFHARKGEQLSIEVAAARLGSPLDSVIEVLDAQGQPIPRATLHCLSETTTTLADRDSRTAGLRLTSTTSLHYGDYVMVGDELDQVIDIPDQPDYDVRFRNAEGMRWALFGTSPTAHAINTPVYRVEILPPGAEFPPNGLPVFHLTWRNDDGGPGFGADSKLDFVAPQEGDYILHLKDVRGLEGDDFAYRLSLHDASPDYKLAADPDNPNIPRGASALVEVTASRVKGYEGPIDIKVEGLPAGITASGATIPAGQDSTVILLSADDHASVDAAPAKFKIVGHAEVNGRDLSRVANADAPLELVAAVPPPDAVVTAGPQRITIEPGKDVKVTLHVERRKGFEGRVPCNILNLPPGVTVVNSGLNGITVAENQSTSAFTLHAEDWAKPITQPIYVVGKVESNSPTSHPSSPLLIEVTGNKQAAAISPAKPGAGFPTVGDAGSPKR